MPRCELDVLSQEEISLPAAVIQRKDGRGEVILVAVAGKNEQGLIRQGGETCSQIIKQKQSGRQFHQKTAVGKKGNAHGGNLLIVKIL
jgi:hypothetical protein